MGKRISIENDPAGFAIEQLELIQASIKAKTDLVGGLAYLTGFATSWSIFVYTDPDDEKNNGQAITVLLYVSVLLAMTALYYQQKNTFDKLQAIIQTLESIRASSSSYSSYSSSESSNTSDAVITYKILQAHSKNSAAQSSIEAMIASLVAVHEAKINRYETSKRSSEVSSGCSFFAAVPTAPEAIQIFDADEENQQLLNSVTC